MFLKLKYLSFVNSKAFPNRITALNNRVKHGHLNTANVLDGMNSCIYISIPNQTL